MQTPYSTKPYMMRESSSVSLIQRASTMAMSTKRRALTIVVSLVGLAGAMLSLFSSSQDQAGVGTNNSERSAPPADLEETRVSQRINAFVAKHDALGYYHDSARHQYVIVLPKGVPLVSQQDISKAISANARSEQRDMTLALYDEMVTEILRRDFHPDAKRYTYGAHLDVQTGRLALVSDAPQYVLQPIISRYPGKIEVSFGRITNAPGTAPSR